MIKGEDYTVEVGDPTEFDQSYIEEAVIRTGLNLLMQRIRANTQKNGFWEGENVDVHRKINLIHCELSEWVEGLRDGNPPDRHLPDFKSGEVEAIDAIIRIIDLCDQAGYNWVEAIMAKDKFNRTREFLHGRKF